MSIKTLILDRFARRKDAESHILPLEGQRKALRRIVEDTILARRITISGAGKTLALCVAESRVFALSCRIEKTEVLAVNFAQTALSSTLKAEISEALGIFLTPGEALAVSFSSFEPPAEKGHAIRADALLSPVRKSAPVAARKPAMPIVADSPSQRFLNDVTADLQDSRSFAFGGPASGLPASLEGLHKKLAAALDGPLLCLAMADNPAQDTYVFALDETGGMAAKLHRQKLGKLCVAWRKSQQIPK